MVLLLPLHAAAQDVERPWVDGVSAGIGLTLYHGDLDANAENEIIRFLTSGFINAFVGVDRRYGPLAAELSLNFNRIAIDLAELEMDTSVISLELGVSYPVLLPRRLLRVFVSTGPAAVLHGYQRFPDADPLFKRVENRILPAFSVGLIFQDYVRIGLRVLPTDYLDGTVGLSGPIDLLSFINVGYRIDLNR